MTIVAIKKSDVIKSLKTEPLLKSTGNWVTVSGVDRNDTDDDAPYVSAKGRLRDLNKKKGCHVCAVGAVIRSHLAVDQTPLSLQRACEAAVKYGAGSEYDDLNEALAGAEKKLHVPMTALSHLFESLSQGFFYEDKLSPDEVRSECISFVKKHFPDVIEVDIDGAKPARGVKVIKRDNHPSE
jgi:hypothetical protein